MFRLIKLALYAAIGYALYEIYQGMVQEQGGGGGGRGQGSSSRQGALAGMGGGSAGGSPRAMNMTGGGGGTEVSTGDASGTQVTHRVGRGVTM